MLRGPRPACGVQWAEDGLRAAACDASGALVAHARVDLSDPPQGAWAQAFRVLRGAAHGLGRDAVCCAPPGWIDALPLRLPGTGDLEELLLERAPQHLSYSLDDAVLDYLGPDARDDGSRRALLVALPRQRALELLAAAEGGGFRVAAIETAGVGLHRLLRRDRRLDARRALVVHLEREHCLFLVLDSESLHVERALGWGTSRLEAALAARLDVPRTSAAHLLRAAPESAGEAQAATREILSPALGELATEVERVLGYCRAEFRAGVDRVLLSGAAGDVRSVREALQRLAPEAEDAFPEPRGGPGVEADLAVAHGLALRFLESSCASST